MPAPDYQALLTGARQPSRHDLEPVARADARESNPSDLQFTMTAGTNGLIKYHGHDLSWFERSWSEIRPHLDEDGNADADSWSTALDGFFERVLAKTNDLPALFHCRWSDYWSMSDNVFKYLAIAEIPFVRACGAKHDLAFATVIDDHRKAGIERLAKHRRRRRLTQEDIWATDHWIHCLNAWHPLCTTAFIISYRSMIRGSCSDDQIVAAKTLPGITAMDH